MTPAERVRREIERMRDDAPPLDAECLALRGTFDAALRREITYSRRSGKGRGGSSRSTFACCRCHALIKSRIARCSKCGHSHSPADPGQALT